MQGKRLAAFVAALLMPLHAALPQAFDPVLPLTDAIGVCDLVDAREIEENAGPDLEDCVAASAALFAAAGMLSVADQERLGLAYVDIIRAARPAETFDKLPPTVDLLADIFRTMSYRQCWPRGVPSTLDACMAAIRIMTIASQAFPPDAVETVAIDICIGSQGRSEWQRAVLGVVDELVARLATGRDPVMQSPIDRVAELRAECRLVG